MALMLVEVGFTSSLWDCLALLHALYQNFGNTSQSHGVPQVMLCQLSLCPLQDVLLGHDLDSCFTIVVHCRSQSR